MLNSEFNLYKREWLSVVFKDRNHQYGAYQLRSNYADVLTKAMAVTLFTVSALGVTATVISRSKPVLPLTQTTICPVVNVEKIYDVPKAKQPPKTKQEAPKAEPPAKAVQQVSTTKFVEMKPVPDELVKEDVKAPDPNLAVGSVDKIVDNSPAGAQNVMPDDTKGRGTGDGPAIDNSMHDYGEGLQVMPEPVGGDKAWAKFLQKNLRYPGQAQDVGVSGKVYLSFIIEKDGHLSNITVERKGGYGFDEEATRVLKLAPAWKPGMQNNQAVRVRYMIPINFQLAEQ